MKILFLAPRFPLPTVKGDKLRAWHIIRALSRIHQVTLLTYVCTEEERERIPEVERVCRCVALPFDTTRRFLGLGRCVGRRDPFQVLLYESPEMKRKVAAYLPRVDAVHLNTLRMAGNLPSECDKPLVVDFIDALSATYGKYQGLPPVSWFFKAEARLLRAAECALATRAALCMAVSETDARMVSPVVSVVPHGVDTDAFSPPPPEAKRSGIVFTGNLRYPPNVEAAVWLAEEVLPRVRKRFPGSSLRLVGAYPARRVRALAGDGIEVTGYVPNVADELRRAAVAVAPVRSGSGVKTKVLEAMACGTPVVATQEANAGIDAQNGRDILLAEKADGFAEAVVRLLGNGERASNIGAAGRRFVEERFNLGVVGRILLRRYSKVEKEARKDD